jgi:acetyl esterase/lipase
MKFVVAAVFALPILLADQIPPFFVDTVVALGRTEAKFVGQPPEWTTEASGFLYGYLVKISGAGDPASIERTRDIPEIVVHGDADNVVSVNSSRVMVEAMKKLGVEVKYIEVPGGSHTDVPGPNMAAIFDFFDAHRKGVKSTAAIR